jgi:hypothetical protein
VPAEPVIPWRVSHPSRNQAHCCLTSVLNGNWCIRHGKSADCSKMILIMQHFIFINIVSDNGNDYLGFIEVDASG